MGGSGKGGSTHVHLYPQPVDGDGETSSDGVWEGSSVINVPHKQVKQVCLPTLPTRSNTMFTVHCSIGENSGPIIMVVQ